MASARYAALKKQVRQLTITLLPRSLKSDLLDLTPRLSVRALSFRVLSHAEFESYFEDRAIELATVCHHAYRQRRHISPTTLAMIGFSGVNMQAPPRTASAPASKRDRDWNQLTRLDYRIGKSITTYNNQIQHQNHGIKEANLLAILLPLGMDISDIDPGLLTEFNNFGSQRGEAAHSSTVGQVRTGVNPIDEYKRVQRILSDLLVLDLKLTQMLKRAAEATAHRQRCRSPAQPR